MKLLFVIGTLNTGGAEKQMVTLIEELSKRGHQCDVFALTKEGSLLKELYKLNVDVHDGRYMSGPGKIWFLRQLTKNIFRAWKLMRQQDYDVIHCYLPLANFIGSLSGRLARSKAIVTSKRALGTHQDRFKLWRYFDLASNRLSNVITVNSEGVLSDTILRENVKLSSTQLIYNGLNITPFLDAKIKREDIRRQLELTDSHIAIVIVANLIPYKGHEDAIRAVSLTVESYPEIKLICAGEDRGIKNGLTALSRTLNIEKNIVFIGRCNYVPSLLAAADIGLVASHEEGFCNALLEQMASGLPVIATDVGGNAEALHDEKYGLLVKAHSPEDIASAVKKILTNRNWANETAKQASEYVKRTFSIEKMVSSHEKLYSSLITKKAI